jgi:hypothetical protein
MLGPRTERALAQAQAQVQQQGWGDWLLHQAGPATLTGLVTITAVLTVLGYFGTALAWRLWIARKWRKRARDRAARAN